MLVLASGHQICTLDLVMIAYRMLAMSTDTDHASAAAMDYEAATFTP
ncbi:MAG: hypothetical protein ABI776_08440 [Nocardioidaceae bacterium]